MDPISYDLVEAAVRRLTLDPYSHVPRFLLVVDADALLSSIDNHCRSGTPTRLLRIAASIGSRVYASEHVLAETYAGFPKLSSRAASASALQACFEQEYLQLIRWVTIDPAGVTDERVDQVTDRTDAPTARLASLIAPCLVLSGDKSLRRPGFAPPAWREAAAFGAAVVEAADQQAQMMFALGLPAVLLVGGAIELGKKAHLPWWVTTAALGFGGYAILRDPRWRAVAGGWAMSFVETVANEWAEIAAQEQAGVDGLRELLLEPVPDAQLKQRIATVLARARHPLLASEILDLIVTHFEPAGSPTPTLVEVRSQLRSAPEFTQPAGYRWQVGRSAPRLLSVRA